MEIEHKQLFCEGISFYITSKNKEHKGIETQRGQGESCRETKQNVDVIQYPRALNSQSTLWSWENKSMAQLSTD